MELRSLSQNYKMIVAYDGGNYHGWQKTKMGPSIEETLEMLLNVPLQAASRTDAGVHALGQVINFIYPEFPDLEMLNGKLPKDISIQSIEPVSQNFHPTLDSLKKEYHYFICTETNQAPHFRRTSWHIPKRVDYDLMKNAANRLCGKHDFSAFCNVQQNETYACPIRNIHSITIEKLPNKRYQFRITGDHFLYKMVRNLIGTIVQVGSGKIPLSKVSTILESCDRKNAGITAPANGLTLAKITYPTVPKLRRLSSFSCDSL